MPKHGRMAAGITDMGDTLLNQNVQHELPGSHADLPAAGLGDPAANPALHHEVLGIPCEVMEPARGRDGLPIAVAQREQQVLTEKLVEGEGGEVIEEVGEVHKRLQEPAGRGVSRMPSPGCRRGDAPAATPTRPR